VNKALHKLAPRFPGINCWRKAIVNHIWFASQNCGESSDELIRIWESMLNHVQNKHEWVDSKGIARKCLHAPLSDEKIQSTDWIEDEIEIHVLKKVYLYHVTKKGLQVNKLLQFTGFVQYTPHQRIEAMQIFCSY
jgi:hypothetical protein